MSDQHSSSSPAPDVTLAARSAALDLLAEVLRHQRPLDDALEAHPGLKALEARDRAFARLLVSTMLRRLGQIDALLRGALSDPQTTRVEVIDLLRLGATQLLFLGTPAHAAVDTTVNLAEARGYAHYKGLINAVLRHLGADGAAAVEAQDAARLNTPDWLAQAWTRAYGEDTARRIMLAHLQEAPLDLTLNPKMAADAAEAQAWAGRLDAEILPTGSLRRHGGGSVADLPGFAEGAWWVQDAAAALPVRLLGEVAGLDVLDLCAAPGGKTAQLVARGARVTALDRSPARLARLAENLARLGFEAHSLVADAAAWHPETLADAVLLDGPCSATGTIRRHPDVARLKSPSDITRLSAAQARLLRAAAHMVRVGGLVIYCACSLQPEEGEDIVATVLGEGAPLRRVPVNAAEIGGLTECITDEGDLRCLPFHLAETGGLDGFYAARLERLA